MYNKNYKTTTWKGLKKYKCNYCSFDTLSKDAMKEHINREHTEKPKKEPVSVPMYDRFGNLIKYK